MLKPPSLLHSADLQPLNLATSRADLTSVDEKATMSRVMPMMVYRATLPVLIGLLGLAVTSLMAVMQQDAAEREQQLMFEQVVERQHLVLADGVAGHLHELDEAVDFVTAVFPSDVEEYRRFFGSSVLAEKLSKLDPGVFVVERIDLDGVGALESREHALGNDDFTVQILEPPSTDSYLVVTRTEKDVTLGQLSIEGLEISSLVSELLESDAPPAGQLIKPLDDNSLLTQLLVSGQVGEVAASPATIVAVTNSIPDTATGETIAWVLRLFDPRTLLTGLDANVDRRLNVEVSMDVLDSPVTLGETDEPLLFADAPLAAEVTTTTSGLTWTTRIWASSEFGVPTKLLDQGATWTFGLLVTSAVMIGAVWRAVQEFRLSRANFELEHARTLASTDSLTGLLNRQGFIDGVRELDPGMCGTLFFIDLDGFKQVNDTRGHEAGDTVLREAATLLSSQFRSVDLVGRFGGDEFAVFTPELVDDEHHARLSERVIESLSVLEDEVSCSVGATTKGPHDPVDVLELIRRADEAMYRAKQRGGGRFESSSSV